MPAVEAGPVAARPEWVVRVAVEIAAVRRAQRVVKAAAAIAVAVRPEWVVRAAVEIVAAAALMPEPVADRAPVDRRMPAAAVADQPMPVRGAAGAGEAPPI